MAYVSAKLDIVTQRIGGLSPRFWAYDAGSDSDATIVGTGYFSDGFTKGMQLGDIVDAVYSTGTIKYKRYQVSSAGTATSVAATVAAPTAIS